MAPLVGLIHLFVYEYKDKPRGTLGLYEHLMSAWQVTTFAVILKLFMVQPKESLATDLLEQGVS